jgi:hypothetical protein
LPRDGWDMGYGTSECAATVMVRARVYGGSND